MGLKVTYPAGSALAQREAAKVHKALAPIAAEHPDVDIIIAVRQEATTKASGAKPRVTWAADLAGGNRGRR